MNRNGNIELLIADVREEWRDKSLTILKLELKLLYKQDCSRNWTEASKKEKERVQVDTQQNS
jgi:hypothetical protein